MCSKPDYPQKFLSLASQFVTLLKIFSEDEFGIITPMTVPLKDDVTVHTHRDSVPDDVTLTDPLRTKSWCIHHTKRVLKDPW